MNPDLEHLIVLQAQDLELGRLRAELTNEPRRVLAAEKALTDAQKGLGTCRDGLAREEKLRRNQESEVQTQRGKVERLRRSLNGATSAAQVSAFEHEISFAEAAISKLEDEEFASLERTEALEAQQVAAAELVAKTEKELEADRARAAQVRTDNTARIAGVERERTSLRKQIAERWLPVYDRLAKVRGTAVAEAVGNATVGKCAACQMGVRPQRWQDLIGGEHEDEIYACESCGRLLFWDPRRDAPRTWAAGDRLGHAQAHEKGTPPRTGELP